MEINASVAHPDRRELELREIRVRVNSSILTFKPDDTTFEITNMATPHMNQTEFDGNILDTERTEDVVVHTLSLTTGMDIVIPSHKTPQGVWKLSLYIRNKGSATGEGILGNVFYEFLRIHYCSLDCMFSFRSNPERLMHCRIWHNRAYYRVCICFVHLDSR